MSNAKKKLIKIKDVMKREVIMMDGMETVNSAIEILRKHDARCVIISKRQVQRV